jgi:fumarylacetoacetase
MKPVIDATHDPSTESWVPSANQPGTDFPIQNLPYGVFRRRASSEPPHVGVAIGDFALDVTACGQEGLLDGASSPATEACVSESLNGLMALGQRHWSTLRHALHTLLRADASGAEHVRELVEKHLVPLAEAQLFVPAQIGDYTDFYASVFHAANVGSMFRPDHPLLPNYKYVPIGYHGRASTIVVSGTDVRRPAGQLHDGSLGPPKFAPTERLDYELEVGFFAGPGNPLGMPIPISEAESHIFGLCLLNDWSARDIQAWEYQPLGPFLAKSFSTSISPWVVTRDALAPFRTAALRRPADDPTPLPYLNSAEDREHGAVHLVLEVFLRSEKMRASGLGAFRLSRGDFSDMYWTMAQMLAHQTSNGCNLRPGDLLASGTVSGRSKDSRGCMLELTWRGTEPMELPTGERRQFLEDGDEVILTGSCESPGFRRIGFGECRGIVRPAKDGSAT